MPEALEINNSFSIPMDEIQMAAVRSSGPGGQNVNKVATKITLRWSLSDSTAVPEQWRERLLQRFQTRITQNGELVIHSQKHRTQARNRQECLEKLRTLLQEAMIVKPPRKRKKVSQAAKQRRLDSKKRQSQKKQLRQAPRFDQ